MFCKRSSKRARGPAHKTVNAMVRPPVSSLEFAQDRHPPTILVLATPEDSHTASPKSRKGLISNVFQQASTTISQSSSPRREQQLPISRFQHRRSQSDPPSRSSDPTPSKNMAQQRVSSIHHYHTLMALHLSRLRYRPPRASIYPFGPMSCSHPSQSPTSAFALTLNRPCLPFPPFRLHPTRRLPCSKKSAPLLCFLNALCPPDLLRIRMAIPSPTPLILKRPKWPRTTFTR